ADHAFVLTSGTCEVTRAGGGPPRRLGPGDVFGETAVIAQERATATVTALEEVVVTLVTREAIDSDLGLDSWVGAFMRALAERARHPSRDDLASARVIDAARV